MSIVRPISDRWNCSGNRYFSYRVAEALRYAQTPACSHLDKRRNNEGITDCQLLVAMSETDGGHLAYFLNLRDAGKKVHPNVLRAKLGIVPGLEIPDFQYRDQLVTNRELTDVRPSNFISEVLYEAAELDGQPRIVYEKEILSSLADKAYSHGGYRPSIEVDKLLFDCALATAQEFTARAKDKGVFLPQISHGNTEHVFPDAVGKISYMTSGGSGIPTTKTPHGQYFDRVIKPVTEEVLV